MKKIFVYLEACNRRALDATRVIDYLSKNNYKIVHKPENADAIILFTCAAADRSTSASIQRIKQFQKYGVELVVAGCLPAIEKEKLDKIFNGKTLDTKELDTCLEVFFPPKNDVTFNKIEEANICFQNFNEDKFLLTIRNCLQRTQLLGKIYQIIEDYILTNLLGKHSLLYRFYSTKKGKYFYVRISSGCLGNCSYCGIKKAIGPFKSKTIDEVVGEFRKGIGGGYNNFIISADDAGAYGLDINSSFPELLDEITKIPGNFKVLIHSFSPRWLIEYIDELEEIVKRKKIISIFICLQSGSSRILKLMNRYSDINKMKDAFLRLKRADPDLLVNTDILVGFPTESRKDFDKTLSFFKEIDFNSGSFVGFSLKTDTDAEKIEPKFSSEEIIDRMNHSKNFLRKEYKMVTLSKTFFLFGKK